jgi:hypothetical protein
MVMSLHFDPVLAYISFRISGIPSMGTYSAIFGYMSHEESSKLEQRKRNHAEVGVTPESTV